MGFWNKLFGESTETTDQPSNKEEQSISDQPSTDREQKSDQDNFDKGLEQTRTSFSERFNRFLANFRRVDESFFEELEETLISADVGFEMTMELVDALRTEAKLQNAKSSEEIKQVILQKLVQLYDPTANDATQKINLSTSVEPTIILFVGVNGVGKTTTVGKLANKYHQAGKKVLLAAADTFRAGAVKQLQEWGERVNVPVISGAEKADPASVVYEAVKKARSENYDILLVDTAGRLQNNVNLMQELAKMKRIIQREIPDAPHEILLVLDATTGQNALQQTKLFKDSSDVTGLVLTKLDGTAKGGIVLAIRHEMNIPVKLVGFGEKVTDLREFDSKNYLHGLLKDLIS